MASEDVGADVMIEPVEQRTVVLTLEGRDEVLTARAEAMMPQCPAGRTPPRVCTPTGRSKGCVCPAFRSSRVT